MILCHRPPYTPFMDDRFSRLPGVVPLDEADWIVAPEDTAAQLAYREQLLGEQPDAVVALLPEAQAAADELLTLVLDALSRHSDWQVKANEVQRPGGTIVALEHSAPLLSLGRLVSEDLCLMTRTVDEDVYRLSAGVLCFPAGWSLAEKLGQTMDAIHGPVPHYDLAVSRRTDKLMTAIRVGRPLLRYNWGIWDDPELHAPPAAEGIWNNRGLGDPAYYRTERQTLLRLPDSRAIVFGIRTTVSPFNGFTAAEALAFDAELARQDTKTMLYKGGVDFFARARTRLADIAAQL